MPETLTSFKLLSFDVYGTLIDWERGVLTALAPALENLPKKEETPSRDQILRLFAALEAALEKTHPSWPYSRVLAAVYPKLLQALGLPPPSEEESQTFGNSVGDWPPFPDTVAALKRLRETYKLVVLSNVDTASFRASNVRALEGFEFDAVYTAQEIGSYKPDHRNFEYMLGEVGRRFGVMKDEVLQTAQSQFHDHHPARELGIRSVWISRPEAVMGNREDPVFDWRFDTLGDMADAVEREVQGRE